MSVSIETEQNRTFQTLSEAIPQKGKAIPHSNAPLQRMVQGPDGVGGSVMTRRRKARERKTSICHGARYSFHMSRYSIFISLMQSLCNSWHYGNTDLDRTISDFMVRVSKRFTEPH
eukprot:Gregarina_sp_Poly_1__6573@NODE_3524_length_1036_cov_14_084623_g2234_i0_p1_GENE_NODE_3524_length_1036_cov_14_084623_g2234_i0NODE_3524_length_1036_cov_14_084623_g2234_i0_p1_ORF_typecomplete_len116_score7_96_NODE_3524_length_1036_cov_14_084623_g2234_i0255602